MSDMLQLSDEELMNLDDDSLAHDSQEAESNQDNDSNSDYETEQEAEQDDDEAEYAEGDEAQAQIDYEAFYKKLTSPFKANGKELKIDDPDDMIALMQQGANYSKKMEAIKPNLHAIKTLESHGLTDPEKLGFMVDLYHKKPEAIARLVKDANIDLYEFDIDVADEYKPSQVQTPSAFEETLEQVRDANPQFDKVLQDVSNWDNGSKAQLGQKPELLGILSQHQESGLYEEIVATIEYEKMLGRLKGVGFLESYAMVEGQIMQQGKFVGQKPKQTPSKQSLSMPKKQSKSVQSPLHLSDAEFLEYMNNL